MFHVCKCEIQTAFICVYHAHLYAKYNETRCLFNLFNFIIVSLQQLYLLKYRKYFILYASKLLETLHLTLASYNTI